MEELLVDIKEKLLSNTYTNEEHIRLSLVCRLLLKLGWDIWNPKEVNTEFPPTRSEDNTKVDIALFAQGSIPSIFIETKAIGKLVPNLSSIERQVRDYNRNNTAPFSVITDGRIWRFYFSQTAGEFHEKCFKECDLISDDIDILEEILVLFLGKDNILNGRAESEALQYLQFTKLEKAVQDLLHQARQMTDVPPFPRLPEALAELVNRKGFDVSETQAAELLQRMSMPQPSMLKFPSPERPMKSPIKSPMKCRESLPVHPKIPLLNPENPGVLKFTAVEGTIGGKYGEKWNRLIYQGIELALNHGHDIYNLGVNIREGEYEEKGYAYISHLNISVQNMQASRAFKILLRMAKMLKCNLELTITWKEKSPRAGEQAMIRWP